MNAPERGPLQNWFSANDVSKKFRPALVWPGIRPNFSEESWRGIRVFCRFACIQKMKETPEQFQARADATAKNTSEFIRSKEGRAWLDLMRRKLAESKARNRLFAKSS